MAAGTAIAGRIELADPDFVDRLRTYSGMHAISPVLIGLSMPCVAIAIFAPRGYNVLQAAAFAVLCIVMLVATTIFALSVFNSGRVAAVAFDIAGRRLELISIATFARRTETVPFSSIADVRVNTRYNRAGRAFVTTEVVMRTGEVMVLPVAPSDAELRAVRLAIALQRDAYQL